MKTPFKGLGKNFQGLIHGRWYDPLVGGGLIPLPSAGLTFPAVLGIFLAEKLEARSGNALGGFYAEIYGKICSLGCNLLSLFSGCRGA